MPARARASTIAGFNAERQRQMYGWHRWRMRRAAQLKAEPLCAFCLKEGKAVVASVADHIVPPRGNWNQFWSGKLQSLCQRCHDSTKHRQENQQYRPNQAREALERKLGYSLAIGADGWPTDPNHPANRPRPGP